MEEYRQKISEILNLKKLKPLSEIVLDDLKYDILTKSDELLLNLIFSPCTTQKDLDDFLEKWDIEVQGGHKALMLSYFMKTHPDLTFSDYVKPRLDGLLKFYRFQNLKLIPHYQKICRELEKYFASSLLSSSDYEEYLKNYNKVVTIGFLRRGKR